MVPDDPVQRVLRLCIICGVDVGRQYVSKDVSYERTIGTSAVGKIQSAGGGTFLIKGDTFKRKERKVSVDVDERGNASQTTVMLDRFVPAINAIELTPDHQLGQIVKIA